MAWLMMVQAAGLRAGIADDGVISSWERTFSCLIYRRVQERVCVEGACAFRGIMMGQDMAGLLASSSGV